MEKFKKKVCQKKMSRGTELPGRFGSSGGLKVSGSPFKNFMQPFPNTQKKPKVVATTGGTSLAEKRCETSSSFMSLMKNIEQHDSNIT